MIEPLDYLSDDWVPAELRPAWNSLGKDLVDRATRLMADYVPQAEGIRLHGDCHVGNILWRDDTPHFVDLDDCVTGPAIQDLWMFLSGDRAQKELQLAELIAGYEEFNDLDPKEIKWIEALRTARMVYYSAWLARRWDDPAFPAAFPWFGQERYWADQILALQGATGAAGRGTTASLVKTGTLGRGALNLRDARRDKSASTPRTKIGFSRAHSDQAL